MNRAKISLAAARVNAGLRQKEVAKIIGITPTTLGNWEKGATCPDMGNAQRLAELYGLKTDDIFFANQVLLNKK